MSPIDREPFGLQRPELQFRDPSTILFITGVALVGKSSIASIVGSSIQGCIVQNMDIVRILAQQADEMKPEAERNPFLRYGSCDSYAFVGDGSYSPESLVAGFNCYASAVGSLLTTIVPKLESQGAQKVLFEGVQLTPQVVSAFLNNDNKLIVVTSNESRLASNLSKKYGDDQELLERYSVDKLLLLQREFKRQSEEIDSNKILFIDNTFDYRDSAVRILRSLIACGVIE